MGGSYLRDDAVIEPLVRSWYAWSYLIAPASSAMYVANAHLKLMDSFVAAPQVHARAMKDPALRGGPFVGCDVERVAEVRALADETRRRASDLLELAAAIAATEQMVAAEAKGLSLEPLYAKVAAPLRGYVELAYDLNQAAGVRYFEGLLYRSRFRDPSAESVQLGTRRFDRPDLAFNTPRLESPDALRIRGPLGRPELDRLYRARHEPTDPDALAEALGVEGADRARLASFFGDRPGRRPAPPYASTVPRVRYFGHASVLIERAGVAVLTDPVPLHGGGGPELDRFTSADLPERIDYVVLTHNHQDHVMLEALLELRHRIGTIVIPASPGGRLHDPALALVLRAVGFERVHELRELEELPIEGGGIMALPFLGEHGDLDVRTKCAYAVRLGDRRVVFLADSNNLDPALYDHLRPLLDPVDVLFIGMECEGAPMSWIYGPLFVRPIARSADQARRLNGSDSGKAIAIVERLAPKEVYVYAMGQEPWLSHVMTMEYSDASRAIVESNALLRHCRDRSIVAERLYVKKELVLGDGPR